MITLHAIRTSILQLWRTMTNGCALTVEYVAFVQGHNRGKHFWPVRSVIVITMFIVSLVNKVFYCCFSIGSSHIFAGCLPSYASVSQYMIGGEFVVCFVLWGVLLKPHWSIDTHLSWFQLKALVGVCRKHKRERIAICVQTVFPASNAVPPMYVIYI